MGKTDSPTPPEALSADTVLANLQQAYDRHLKADVTSGADGLTEGVTMEEMEGDDAGKFKLTVVDTYPVNAGAPDQPPQMSRTHALIHLANSNGAPRFWKVTFPTSETAQFTLTMIISQGFAEAIGRAARTGTEEPTEEPTDGDALRAAIERAELAELDEHAVPVPAEVRDRHLESLHAALDEQRGESGD